MMVELERILIFIIIILRIMDNVRPMGRWHKSKIEKLEAKKVDFFFNI